MGTGRRWRRLAAKGREILDERVGQHLRCSISSRCNCDDPGEFLDTGLGPAVLDGLVDSSQLHVAMVVTVVEDAFDVARRTDRCRDSPGRDGTSPTGPRLWFPAPRQPALDMGEPGQRSDEPPSRDTDNCPGRLPGSSAHNSPCP